MKRYLSLILALLIVVGLLSGCGTAKPAEQAAPSAEPAQAAPVEAEKVPEPAEQLPTERTFTDDLGREFIIPYEITKIAVSGPLAQIYILPIGADLMVGFANEFSEDAKKYFSDEILALPSLGQLYGGKGTMDLEALLAAAPQLVIDVGEAKKNIAEDLDALTEQTNIPFIHIDATVATSGAAYRRLGELLGRTEKGEELAAYLEGVYASISGMMERVDADNARRTVLYCLGDKGLNVLAEGSFHAESINAVSDNVAKLEEVVSSGMGNEVDMEQLLLWNPEVIVFAPDSIYDQISSDKVWNKLSAVSEGQYYKTPTGPYGWLQSPPAVQRYLGMLWLGALLYPDYCEYNLKDEITEYYKLFYGYELSEAEFNQLTEYSLP